LRNRAGRRAPAVTSNVAHAVVDGVGSTTAASVALLLVLGWVVVGVTTGFAELWVSVNFVSAQPGAVHHCSGGATKKPLP
jgi:hypothetical protein